MIEQKNNPISLCIKKSQLFPQEVFNHFFKLIW